MSTAVKPTKMFWIVAIIFLCWNAFGCFAYYLDMTMTEAAYVEAYGQAMADVRDMYPVWSVAAYAIAVWGGLLASIVLLIRKGFAVPLFVISLIAAVVSFAWGMTNAEARAAAGSMGFVMPLIVIAMGLFEIWFSRLMRGKGVLT